MGQMNTEKKNALLSSRPAGRLFPARAIITVLTNPAGCKIILTVKGNHEMAQNGQITKI